MKADAGAAWVTSRLEFWKYPELMAQFPFAHTIDMTYRLVSGALEVETLLQNHSSEPMPVGIGYHPYFQVHDAPRDEWRGYLAPRAKLTFASPTLPTRAPRPGTPFPPRCARRGPPGQGFRQPSKRPGVAGAISL